MIDPWHFDLAGSTAVGVEVADFGDLPLAMEALGLAPSQPTVVIVGGANELAQTDIDRLQDTFGVGIVPVLQRHNVVAVDGGTDSGVMRLGGRARGSRGALYPLVGVAAVGTVRIPGRAMTEDAAALEPHHSHFIIVPGDEWGAEAPWIAQAASVLGAGRPTVTVLINGGKIALDDIEYSVRANRRVIVIAGSGRTADAVSDALTGQSPDRRLRELAASGLISSVPIDDPPALAALLEAVFGEPSVVT